MTDGNAGARWPAHCHSPSSCTRNRGCMYTNCKYEGQDIGPAIDAAIADPTKGFSSPAPVERREAIALDDAAKKLAEWIGYSWDGIRDERIADKGFKPWCFDGLGHKKYQGGKEDLRDIVRDILALPFAAKDEASIRADEREKCVKIAEEKYRGHSATLGSQRARNYEHAGKGIAAAIRNKGDAL